MGFINMNCDDLLLWNFVCIDSFIFYVICIFFVPCENTFDDAQGCGLSLAHIGSKIFESGPDKIKISWPRPDGLYLSHGATGQFELFIYFITIWMPFVCLGSSPDVCVTMKGPMRLY